MLLLAGLLLCSLTFGTLVAPVSSLQFNPISVQQCAPLLLSFTGLNPLPSRAPASLTIVPFNSTAIVLPLQDTNFSAGIALSFLPFAAGSDFIVSLDDVNGNSIINNSDIFPVLPSPNTNSTCVPELDKLQPSFFTMASPVVSQCQNFTINYNTAVSSQAPSVRLYNPNGPSFLLNTISDDPTSGRAAYTMAFPFGRGIVLVMDNGNGTTETTPLLLVGGDSSSSTACLGADPTDTVSGDISSTGTSVSTSRIIAITASIGGVVVLLGIGLAIYLLRSHRRRDGIVSAETNSLNEKRIIPQVIVLDDPLLNTFDKKSVDTLSPEKGYFDQNSPLSGLQAIPEDQHLVWSEAKQSPGSTDRLSDPASEKGYYDRNSLLSWTQPIPEDQRYLARPEEKPSLGFANHLSDPIDSSSPTVPQPTLLQPPQITRALSKRHLRAPSDVPADLNSRAWSSVSSDSFYPSASEVEPSSLTSPTESHARSVKSVGLPTSPRDGLRATTISKRSNANTHTQEWSGIVR